MSEKKHTISVEDIAKSIQNILIQNEQNKLTAAVIAGLTQQITTAVVAHLKAPEEQE